MAAVQLPVCARQRAQGNMREDMYITGTDTEWDFWYYSVASLFARVNDWELAFQICKLVRWKLSSLGQAIR